MCIRFVAELCNPQPGTELKAEEKIQESDSTDQLTEQLLNKITPELQKHIDYEMKLENEIADLRKTLEKAENEIGRLQKQFDNREDVGKYYTENE